MEPRNEHIIDDLYRNRFHNFEAEPPAGIFEKIKSSAGNKSGQESYFRNYRIPFIGASAVLITGLVFLYLNLSNEDKAVQSQDIRKTAVNNTVKAVSPGNVKNSKPVSVNTEYKKDNSNSTSSANTLVKSKLMTSAGNDETVCGLTAKLKAGLPGRQTSGSWKCDEAGVSFRSGGYSNPYSDPLAEVDVNSPGKYSFTWTETDGKQSVSDDVVIDFVKTPEPDAGKDAMICGNDVELKSTGVNGFWNWMEGVSYINRNMAVTGAHSKNAGSLKFIWTEVVGNCLSRDTVNIAFLSNPVAEIKLAETPKCNGSPVTLFTRTEKGTKYDWDFDDGIVTSRTGDKISVYWKYGTEHLVTLTASNGNNCKTSSELTVKLPVPPVVLFSHVAMDESAPTVVYFVNRTTIGSIAYSDTHNLKFLWKFGDKAFSVDENPEHLYVNKGSYKVTLAVSDEKGCSDSSSTIINLRGNSKSAMEIFTPNGDGINDIFKIPPDDLRDFKCVILSNNGEKLFEWYNQEEGWDGKINHKGNFAAEGLYYYVVTGTDERGKPVKLPGTVYLLRK